MKIKSRNLKSGLTPRSNSHGGATALAFGCSRRGFTLIEILLALVVCAIVLVVIHSVFQSALQLRNKTALAFDEAIPLQHTLNQIKHDLANLAIPGGTLTGNLQTTPTTASATSMSHNGQQVGPIFYTASGTLADSAPWSELRKVSYYLTPSTNGAAGRNLVRSLTRNLLPVAQEEFEDQSLMSGVDNLTFEFYDGRQWATTWDSTTSTNGLPQGIRVQLTLVNGESGQMAQTPIEMVVPIAQQGGTNSTSTSMGGGG